MTYVKKCGKNAKYRKCVVHFNKRRMFFFSQSYTYIRRSNINPSLILLELFYSKDNYHCKDIKIFDVFNIVKDNQYRIVEKYFVNIL